MVERGQFAADGGQDFARLGGVATRQSLLRRANIGGHAGESRRLRRERTLVRASGRQEHGGGKAN
ncbi:MAG: hypothetical protein LBK60_02420 [Verrucomicrobiales bacterium]|nr:hypothetical protein [Verrucomicrobiales bacterium]